MRDEATSTIAQLLFVKRPDLNFAHVVGELDAALARCPADHRTLGWDCDDVAVFDLDGSRIVLGYSDDLQGDHAACLTVSVGHGPNRHLSSALATRRDSLCRMITDRLSGRYGIDEILWHEVETPVSADLIDALIEDLPRQHPEPETEADLTEATDPLEEVDRLMARMAAELEKTAAPQHVTAKHRARRTDGPAKPRRAPVTPVAEVAATAAPEPVANDMPEIPPPLETELSRVRAALYPPQPVAQVAAPSENSIPIRLACHAMNATLIVVALPVGAAVMTYSVLRGEDMKLSARMMVLTGSLLGFGQTPIGQQVMAMI